MNEIKPGTLYLVPTPIGNLSDITERSVEILNNVDLIAAEDTRHTRILLDHLGISKSPVSYHEHNKKEAGPKLIDELKSGHTVAQVSDAGMPVISDPGADLVRLALSEGIPIVPLPGPNAALTALVASGLDARQFVFIGFLPKITAKQKKLLSDISHVPFTLIFYEAPHRLKDTLDTLLKYLGNRRAVTARELTKKFESFNRGTLESIRLHADVEEPRGEYVLLVEGWNESMETGEENQATWQEEAMKQAESLPLKEAARRTAGKFNMSRREIYQFLLENKK